MTPLLAQGNTAEQIQICHHISHAKRLNHHLSIRSTQNFTTHNTVSILKKNPQIKAYPLNDKIIVVHNLAKHQSQPI